MGLSSAHPNLLPPLAHVSTDSAAAGALSISVAGVASQYLFIASVEITISGAAAGSNIAITFTEGGITVLWKTVIATGAAVGTRLVRDFPGRGLGAQNAGNGLDLAATAGGAGTVIIGNVSYYYGPR